MAVMKMQAQESSSSQGHKHLWLENDTERWQELEAEFELSEETSFGW